MEMTRVSYYTKLICYNWYSNYLIAEIMTNLYMIDKEIIRAF